MTANNGRAVVVSRSLLASLARPCRAPRRHFVRSRVEGLFTRPSVMSPSLEDQEIYVSEEVTLQPNSTIEYINEDYLEQIEQMEQQEEEEPPPPPPPAKRPKLITYTDNFLAINNQLLKRVSSYLDKSEELSQSTVWCRKLQTLDQRQRLLAEKAINDILFEASLGKLNKNSVKINGDALSLKPS